MKHILLSAEGILDINGHQLDTPFGSSQVHHGNYGEGKLAVIVNRRQIWIYDGTWSKLLDASIDLNCLVWTGHGLLVGTEAARIAWANDEGLHFITAVDELENRDKWTTPWGGPPDIRSMSVASDGTIFANIHVGWIIRSTDGGVTWQSQTNGLDKDVHQVNTHPTESNIVFCATARGWYLSQDSGLSFDHRWNLSPTYQRATSWFVDRDVILVSVSSGPSGSSATLYRSTSRGDNWEEVSGLPSLSSNINTYQLLTGQQGLGYVIINDNTLYQSSDYGQTWAMVLDTLPKLYQVVKYPKL